MKPLPAWMAEYSKRDVSLMLFAVENADAFHAIAPNHPLTIHCLEMKAMVEAANTLEAQTKRTEGGE